MDLIAIGVELTFMLVMKPFWLMKMVIMCCFRSVFIITHTWLELVRNSIRLHVNLFWNILLWSVAFVALPFRVLNAVHREKTLEHVLLEMQNDFENLMWESKQLEGRLQTAITERKMMELMLEQLEEDHDKALLKIHMLETQLQILNNRNLMKKEIQDKNTWNLKCEVDKYEIPYGIPSWKTDYNNNNLQNLLIDHQKNPTTNNEFIDARRDTAFSKSVFSAVLSISVGIIVYEAEDACVPLVVALIAVAVMSLKSVVDFLCSVENKPGSDVVALLSFNWFILGMLTYPTLPRIVPMLSPFAVRFVDWVLSWVGLSL